MSNKIIPLIPEHVCYVEPFAGAAWAIHSRRIFTAMRDMDAREIEGLTAEERAWRFLYLLKTSYGGGRGLSHTMGRAELARKKWGFGSFKRNRDGATLKLERLAGREAPRAEEGPEDVPCGTDEAKGMRPSFGCGRTGSVKESGIKLPRLNDRLEDAPRGTDGMRRPAFGFTKRRCNGGTARGLTLLDRPMAGGAARGGRVVPGILRPAHERLRGAIIEDLDWRECLARYDSADTFFYIDPPYIGCERYYGAGLFSRGEFGMLADALSGLKGCFLLSINNCPEAFELFGNYERLDLDVKYSVAKERRLQARECLFGNFELSGSGF